RHMRNWKALLFLAAACAAFLACGSSASSPSPSTPSNVTGTPLSMTLTEWKVEVPSTLPHGQYAITITNNGSMEHELLVFKSELYPAQYPVDATGNIQEDGPGITKISDGDNIDRGKSQTRTVDLTQPGLYLFACNLPGHFKQGMYTVVTVT